MSPYNGFKSWLGLVIVMVFVALAVMAAVNEVYSIAVLSIATCLLVGVPMFRQFSRGRRRRG